MNKPRVLLLSCAFMGACLAAIVEHAPVQGATVAGQGPAAAVSVSVAYPQSDPNAVLAMGRADLRAHAWSILEHFTAGGKSDTPDWETWEGKCALGLQGSSAECPSAQATGGNCPTKSKAGGPFVRTQKATINNSVGLMASRRLAAEARAAVPDDVPNPAQANVIRALEDPVQLAKPKARQVAPATSKAAIGRYTEALESTSGLVDGDDCPSNGGAGQARANGDVRVDTSQSAGKTATFYNCDAAGLIYGIPVKVPCEWPDRPVADAVLLRSSTWQGYMRRSSASPGDISTTAPGAVLVKEMWQQLMGCGSNGPPHCGLLHVWANGKSHQRTPTGDGSVGPPGQWDQSVVLIDLKDTSCQPSSTLTVMKTEDIRGATPLVPLGCFRSVMEDETLSANDGAFNYLVLTGFHVMTAETKNWTWSTFFLTDKSDVEGYGADRPASLQAKPWKFFSMNTTVTADPGLTPAPKTAGNPDGFIATNVVFNPYLEGAMPGGPTTNCLYCHRRAVFRNTPNGRDPDTGHPSACSMQRPWQAGCGIKTFVDSDAQSPILSRDRTAYLRTPMYANDPNFTSYPPNGKYYSQAVQTHFIWSLANHFSSP